MGDFGLEDGGGYDLGFDVFGEVVVEDWLVDYVVVGVLVCFGYVKGDIVEEVGLGGVSIWGGEEGDC